MGDLLVSGRVKSSKMLHKDFWRILTNRVPNCETNKSILLMATRNPANSPVEVGSLSHYLSGFMMFQVVGLGISEASTVSTHPSKDPKPY